MIKITAFPRLHITLIGMNNSGYRINGGLGFTINDPNITAEINEGSIFTFIDSRIFPFNDDEVHRLKSIVYEVINLKSFKKNISIRISGEIGSHMGLGSGTLIRLLCLEALFIINDVGYTKKELVKLSRRGGTSGVGVRTYFDGGFAMDIGQTSDAIVPSSVAENSARASKKLTQIKMPSWKIGVCIPNFIPKVTSEEERNFFKRVIPISQEHVNEVLYHSIYGVYGSVAEGNKKYFCEAIKNIQHCHWKKSEWQEYGDEIKSVQTILYRCGAECVGMSSLGPLLFFLGPDIQKIIDDAKNMLEVQNDCTFLETSANNTGRVIKVC